VNTILSLYYYARILRAMYLQPSDEPAFAGNPLGTAIGLACAVVLLVLMVGWGPLDRMTKGYSRLRTAAAPAAGTGTPTTAPAALLPPAGAPVAAAR